MKTVRRLVCLLLCAVMAAGIMLPAFATEKTTSIIEDTPSTSDVEAYGDPWFYLIDTGGDRHVYRGSYTEQPVGVSCTGRAGNKEWVIDYPVEQVLYYHDRLYLSTDHEVRSWDPETKEDMFLFTAQDKIERLAAVNETIYYLCNGIVYQMDLHTKAQTVYLDNLLIQDFWLEDQYTISYMLDEQYIYHMDMRDGSVSREKNIISDLGDPIVKTYNSRGMTLTTLRNKFPDIKDGKKCYWNHRGKSSYNADTITFNPCDYGHTEVTYCNYYNGYQCFGYAEKCGYDVTGYSPAANKNGWSTVYTKSAIATVKAGDIITWKGTDNVGYDSNGNPIHDYGHSIYVIRKEGNTISYTDCNGDWQCGINWGNVRGNTISVTTIQSEFKEGNPNTNFVRKAPSEAQWDTSITITFNANGGSCSTGSKTITAGSTIGDLPTATRDGYYFDGWYTAASGGTQVSAGTTFSENTTLYAHWTLIAYNVSVRPNGGSWPSGYEDPSGQYAPGSKIALTEPVRDGYRFVGWALASSGTGHILEPWGVPLHSDPFFTQTMSDIEAYNNKDNGTVTVNKVAKSNDCPTSSAYMLQITTAGEAHPQLGGFTQLTYSKASNVYYHVILAKIPVGYQIERAATIYGDENEFVWLTSQKGTGEFEAYIYKTVCGTTGTFGSFGNVYLSGPEATSSNPVTWYVGYSEIFNGTGVSSSGSTYTVGYGSGILVALWKEIKYDVCVELTGGEWPEGYDSPDGRYKPGSDIWLATPEKDGYVFVGWALDASGTSHVLEPWGAPKHSDPFFTQSMGDVGPYNYLDNNNVTVSKVARSSDCPTSSAYMLEVTTTGEAAPQVGGFGQMSYSKASGVYYHVILAKIPVGYQIERAGSIYGDENEFVWLTSQKGTGEFEAYIYKTVCGTTGTFGSFGYVYLDGPEATASSPVTWYVGYSEVFDATGIPATGKYYTVGNGPATLVALWKEIKYDVRVELMGGEWPEGYDSPDGRYKPGSDIWLATPKKDGYVFAGWAIDASGTRHILEPWGVPKHSDPFFTQTMGDVEAYNNKDNENVAVTKVAKSSDCPSPSANMLEVTTSGVAHPLLGGFGQKTYSKASGVYYHVILAKIPVGYTIDFGASIYGEENEFEWLTSQKGTGEFETYIYKITCGTTGTFGSFGYVYLDGPEATSSSPVTWYVGYSEVFDATEIPATGKYYTVGNGNGCLYALWNRVEAYQPDKPVIVGVQDQYIEQEDISIRWTAGANTTHCNYWLYVKNGDTWELVSKTDYAESPITENLGVGEYYVYVVATNSRCKDPETNTWLWTSSDYVYFSVVHDYQETVTAPTCTEQGYTTHTCTVCGDSYTDKFVDALGHDFGAWTQTVAPTCTEKGEEKHTCSRCDTFETREVEALGHDYQAVVTEPTCTAGGYTTYTCSRCNDSYVADETEANGHTPSAAVEENRVNPICTENGGFDTVTYCSACGIELNRVHTDLPALGHLWDDGVIDPAATCTSDGVKTYTCLRCGETKTEAITASGHTAGESAKENEVAATCTTSGGYDMVIRCTVCNAILYTEHFETAALGHDYQATVTAPTCSEGGYTTYTCSRCGDSYTADETAALGHDWNEPEYVWADDYSTVTATRTCKNDAGHKETETVNTTSEVTKPATYDAEGEIVYTAAFENEAFATQTKAVTTPKLEEPPVLNNPFKDVKEGAYYYDAVLWAVNSSPQVTAGTSATTFSPNATCTRAQVVTFLWRAKGCPEPEALKEECRGDQRSPAGEQCSPLQVMRSGNPFTDVKEGEYYYKAVLWAVENGITAGTGNGKFSPNQGCTRGQVVTFLWRTEGCPEPVALNSARRDGNLPSAGEQCSPLQGKNGDTAAADGSPVQNPFDDVKDSDYFYTAVLWAVENNITQGTGNGKFSPNQTCTRGQIVTFLYRDLG